ncbi:AI-2E family transporter [Azospirillum sp. SYSU D00513]|uniref:AI-2E family transporter n=1 Tax=Azospirillum sp. SYSU D00513 TaxID=2812561 RepID=UPI001A9724DA|nr:AI-2E family transporter [Azospirillum sp. SYSU D00513]
MDGRIERNEWRSNGSLVRRLLIVLALLSLALLSWRLSSVLLLAFGSVLIGIVLRAAADLVVRYTPVPERWSLAVAGSAMLLLIALAGLLFGSQIASQSGQLAQQLPSMIDHAMQRFGIQGSLEQMLQGKGTAVAGGILSRVGSFGMAFAGGLANLLLMVIAGAFLASEPRLYRRGFVKLFPPREQERIEGTLLTTGRALRLWLLGKLATMALVAVLTTLLLWLAGVPSPLALGLLAGLAEFVTFVGPLVAGAVILIAALAGGVTTFAWAFAAVLVIQQLESNIITPLVQRRAVDLPPALSLFAVLAFGTLFGTLGLLFGVPLAVVAYVVIKKLYVRDTLKEATPILGEG